MTPLQDSLTHLVATLIAGYFIVNFLLLAVHLIDTEFRPIKLWKVVIVVLFGVPMIICYLLFTKKNGNE